MTHAPLAVTTNMVIVDVFAQAKTGLTPTTSTISAHQIIDI